MSKYNIWNEKTGRLWNLFIHYWDELINCRIFRNQIISCYLKSLRSQIHFLRQFYHSHLINSNFGVHWTNVETETFAKKNHRTDLGALQCRSCFFFVQFLIKKDNEIEFFVEIQNSIKSVIKYIVTINKTALHVFWKFFEFVSIKIETKKTFDLKNARRLTKH